MPALTGNAVSLAHNGSAGLTISSLNSSSLTRLQINGANGSLFAVTDAVTGTVFTVNDASGLPIVSVDTGLNDIITLGTYGSNALVVRNNKVGVGTTTPTEALTVSGNISASGTITIDSTSAVTNPKLLITASTASGAGDNVPLVIKGSGVNRLASINLRTTGGSGELYSGWVTGIVGGGIQVNNSFTVSNGNTGPTTGTATFAVLSNGNVGIGTASPSTKLHTIATTEQLRIGYDASNYASTTVSSSGLVTLNAVGASAGFAFANTTRPTSAATGPPAATSLMTNTDVMLDRHVNSIRRMAFAVPTLFSIGGGTSSVSGDIAYLSIASAAAGSVRGASFMDASPHSAFSGVQLNFARPFIASGVFYLRNLTADTTCLRFLIGGAASRLANADAFSTNGVGIEIKNVTSVGYRARLVYYSSTLVGGVPVGYVETAFADFGVGAGIIYGRSNAFVLTNDGLGTVNLYIQSYSDSALTTTKPPVSLATPLITITDAPKAEASGSLFTASLGTTAGDAAGVQVESRVSALQFDYNG